MASEAFQIAKVGQGGQGSQGDQVTEKMLHEA